MIEYLIECTLSTFLEYICCSKFFNAFSFRYETWGNGSEHLHIRFPLHPFVYPSRNILWDFLLQTSLKPLIEPLVCLFKVFPSPGFLKWFLSFPYTRFQPPQPSPKLMALWWSPAFRELSWTTWTPEVLVKTSLTFCSHFYFSLGCLMAGLSSASFGKRGRGWESLPCSPAWAATEQIGKLHCTRENWAWMPLTVDQTVSSFGFYIRICPHGPCTLNCLTRAGKLRLKCQWSFQV